MVDYDDDGYIYEEVKPEPLGGRVRFRSTHLLGEVIELYNAQSYLVWRFDEFFTTHITISANFLGLIDHRALTKRMPAFNKELKRWLWIGNDRPSGRWTKKRLSKPSQEHHWIYVIENASTNGLHLHQLCVVPKAAQKKFDRLVIAWWKRAVGPEFRTEAIKIEHRGSCYERHVQWFRYVTKSVCREAYMFDNDGLPWPFEKVFKPEPYWRTNPTYAPRLYGVCRSLGPKARCEPICAGSEKFIFTSLLDRREYENIYSGWEIGDLENKRSLAALMYTMPC